MIPLQIVKKIKSEENSFKLEVKIESFKAIDWNLSGLYQNKINIFCIFSWINYGHVTVYDFGKSP